MRYVYLFYKNQPAPSFAHRRPAKHGVAGVCYQVVAESGAEFCYPLTLYRVVTSDEPDPNHQVDENAWDSGGKP